MQNILYRLLYVAMCYLLVSCSAGNRNTSTTTATWAWNNGSTILNDSGQYPLQAGESGYPSSRAAASAFSPKSGDLWLFGGLINGLDGPFVINDLWHYNPQANLWIWESGTNPNYGIFNGGYPSSLGQPGGYPPARFGAATWVSSSGNLWVYGGFGLFNGTTGILGDLWEYNVNTRSWSWTSGESIMNATPIYPTSTGESGYPGARRYGVNYTDTNDSLWLFGGSSSYDISILHNDLWRYDVASNTWFWEDGSKTINAFTTYPASIGTPGGNPGARIGAFGWTDKQGNFWLFGGFGYNATESNYLNDLWQYNPITKQWTCYGKYPSTTGDYPIQVGVPGGYPAARTLGSNWVDVNGNLWLYGGQTNASPVVSYYLLSDLWEYNVTSKQWVLRSGTNLPNVIATYPSTIQTSGGYPGSREYSASFTSGNNLFLFGGLSFVSESKNGYLNDLWSFPIN